MTVSSSKPVLALVTAAACLVAMLNSRAHADQPTQKDIDQLRDAVLANFDAQNREDVDDLIASIHPLSDPAQLAELRAECEKLFEEADIRIRLVSMIVNDYNDPAANAAIGMRANIPTCSAYADVVQLTLPADHSYADLEEYPAQMSSFYRHNSASLPESQLVQYTLRFDYDYKGRRWKVHKIVSRPVPVKEWPDNIREVMQGENAQPLSRHGVRPEPSRGGNRK
jgi:hypothetical protein